jgi:hypothetical protein
MNKSTIEAVQPEPQPNSEQKADEGSRGSIAIL